MLLSLADSTTVTVCYMDFPVTGRKTSACLHPFWGTQREYSSKPHKHSIVERTLVFKR